MIYKFKHEYLGGLGIFYTPSLDKAILDESARIAGRQFVVRCLTVECLHGTYIPYKLGVGYYDEDLGKWVVSDCVKVKYVSGDRILDSRYLDTSKSTFTLDEEGENKPKHANVTLQAQGLANQIAKVLQFIKPSRIFDNILQTAHFKNESSANILNIVHAGLIVGGSCNPLIFRVKGDIVDLRVTLVFLAWFSNISDLPEPNCRVFTTGSDVHTVSVDS